MSDMIEHLAPEADEAAAPAEPAFTGADVGAACVAIRLRLHALAAARRAIAREAAEGGAAFKQHERIEADERQLIGILAAAGDADVIAAAAAL